MDLLLLGLGMGIVGGLFPSPLHLIALAQVALGRWTRGILILVGPPGGYQSLWLIERQGDEILRYNWGGVSFVPFTRSG